MRGHTADPVTMASDGQLRRELTHRFIWMHHEHWNVLDAQPEQLNNKRTDAIY